MKTNNKADNALKKVRGVRFFGIFVLTAIIAALIVAAVSAQIGSRDKIPEQEKRKSVVNKTDKKITSIAEQAKLIDPQSGQIRPLTPQEAQKLADGIKKLVNQSDEGLVPVEHPDGSISVDLEGRFQNVTLAKKNSDGSVEQSCVDNTQSASAFFEIDPTYFGDKSKNAVKRPVVEKDENGLEIK